MNLGVCIANLLKRYPAVWVPGIGVFKVNRVPASFDPEKSVFLPPSSSIELIEGQAVGYPITDYLQVQRGVDEAAAMGMLDQAIKDVFDSISRNGQALLDGLGYLVADGASILFRPFEAGNATWKPVEDLSVKTTDEVPEADTTDDVPVASDDEVPAQSHETEVTAEDEPDTGGERAEAAEVPEVPAPAATVETTETDPVVPARGSGRSWWIAAAVLIAVSAAVAVWYLQPSQPTSAPIDSVADDTIQQQAVVDSLAAGAAPVDSVAATAKATSDSAAAPVTPKGPSVTYEIIVGSFATMAQAKKYVAEMKAKGYDLKALDSRMPGNRKKISWGGYATEEEAYRELARVQKTFEPGAWIAKVVHDGN